jgi:beta-xylosidase
MKNLSIVGLTFVFTVLAFLFSVRADTARNPIIWADVPDPSMIRVGGTGGWSATPTTFLAILTRWI